MKRKLKERLKDAVVDHIFVTGYEKIYQREQISPDEHRMWYGPQEKKFVPLFIDDKREKIKDNLVSRLDHRSLKVKHTHLIDCLIDLIIKGFVVENSPLHNEYGLTIKGLNHYQSGKSFEENYRKDRMARLAFRISIVSAIGASISLLKSFNFIDFSY